MTSTPVEASLQDGIKSCLLLLQVATFLDPILVGILKKYTEVTYKFVLSNFKMVHFWQVTLNRKPIILPSIFRTSQLLRAFECITNIFFVLIELQINWFWWPDTPTSFILWDILWNTFDNMLGTNCHPACKWLLHRKCYMTSYSCKLTIILISEVLYVREAIQKK